MVRDIFSIILDKPISRPTNIQIKNKAVIAFIKAMEHIYVNAKAEAFNRESHEKKTNKLYDKGYKQTEYFCHRTL